MDEPALTGRQALDVCWEKLVAIPEVKRGLHHAAPFRQFSWMLNTEQQLIIRKMVNQGISQYQNSMIHSARALCDGGPAADNSEEGVGSTAKSSAPCTVSSELAVAGDVHKPATDSSMDSQKAALLALFVV